MEAKSILLEQLAACRNKNGWFVSLQSAISGLTEEHSVWKETETSNSIREILTHLLFWNERYLNRFKEIPDTPMEGNNDTTFVGQDDLNLAGLIEKLDLILAEWEQMIQECDDATLFEKGPKNHPDKWAAILSHINIHNAYHIGQIIQIRKTQGSWDPKQGVH